MKEDDVLEDRLVSRQIEKAQRKVEAHNFDIRKHLLEYDDVANDQRKVIYQQRNELLESDSVQESIDAIREDVFAEHARRYVPVNSVDEQWDIDGLQRSLADDYGIDADIRKLLESTEEADDNAVTMEVIKAGERHFSEKEAQVGPEIMRQLEKHLMLNVLDQSWKEHLARMITCARASTCAATRRSSPSRNTSARASSCSRRCSTRSSAK